MAKFIPIPEMKSVDPPTWNRFIDGSSGEIGSAARIALVSIEGHRLIYTVRFRFNVTNNVIEYEALLVGLWLVRKMEVKRLHTSCDSQLVASQVNDSFVAKDKSMATYLKIS